MKKIAPFGSWPSSITADLVAGKIPRISEARLIDQRVFWCETRPQEKGRVAIMMHENGHNQCILPNPLSAKSKVHEYGGGSYVVHGHMLYFVLADDQRVYAGDFSRQKFEPIALTPDDGRRYADLRLSPSHQQLIAVCENHKDEVTNSLVSIALNSEIPNVQTIAEGHDFYSNPEFSPDGKTISWLSWDHPNMPWDNTEVWLAECVENAEGLYLHPPVKAAGNGDESIFQPRWSPDGDLYFVSDHNNWWNIQRIRRENLLQHNFIREEVTTIEGEFATPQWTFAMSTYAFLSNEKILATYTANGSWQLVEIDTITLKIQDIPTTCSSIENVDAVDGKGVLVGASPSSVSDIFIVDTDQILRPLLNHAALVAEEEISQAQSFEFPTTQQQTAHVLFYPPHNANYTCDNELPPLIVLSHGGPTGATESNLNFKIQFWTNRGFAVADVNYRGSTGYGRNFRHSLYPHWGEYDVDDVCMVVEFLTQRGLIDRQRCIIKGGSAGGYTTLAALAFRDTFKAGVSLYGIGDLELLAQDTHKFEARYMDKLVGAYPEQKTIYQQRSPLHFVDKINCPLLVFQGLQDKVVPPNQAEAMVNAVKQKGLPVAYVTYPDEAHGFRDAATIQHMLESEHEFYARIFGIELGKPLSLHIANFS